MICPGSGDTRLAVSCPPAACRLAISGPDWEAVCRHHPALVPRLAGSGAVFARMTPDQKQQLVEHVKELGYHVGEWRHVRNRPSEPEIP